jgi:hypothetical protein
MQNLPETQEFPVQRGLPLPLICAKIAAATAKHADLPA